LLWKFPELSFVINANLLLMLRKLIQHAFSAANINYSCALVFVSCISSLLFIQQRIANVDDETIV
jgi:hypothetical protein